MKYTPVKINMISDSGDSHGCWAILSASTDPHNVTAPACKVDADLSHPLLRMDQYMVLAKEYPSTLLIGYQYLISPTFENS